MWKFILLWLVALILCSSKAMAACAFNVTGDFVQSAMQQYQMPIGRNIISVSPDMPVGTEIYRQSINISSAPAFSIICDTSAQFYRYYDYLYLPQAASSVVIPGKKGTIYETGVKGVGIMFWYSANGFPYNRSTTCAALNCNSNGEPAYSDFSLYKIGDIEPGIIQASNLPVARYSMGQTQADAVALAAITLSGSISVTVPTCQLAESRQVVWMGNKKASDFLSKGSVTEWKDASIRLINCPTFYGNTGGLGSVGTWNGSTLNASNTDIRNTWTLTLMPNTGITEASSGIMSIDSSPESATGIGIQLAKAPNESSILNLSAAYSGNFPSDGAATITIPLFARYIQTGEGISTGTANGLLTYFIEYK
ncbi:fimbrial protein [Enterobacter roggenkampii]|uniref:fimbrial protein n=1 Tax=Enterobacter roggenkampii TaxID=1812935 RepID=UPI003BE515E9